jgi:zinc protease
MKRREWTNLVYRLMRWRGNGVRQGGVLSILALGVAAWTSADIPPRPEQIQFAPLHFDPPNASDFRHVLSNGVVVFLAASHEFPLINLSLTCRGGAYLDPPDKIGLAAATAAMMRRGGAGELAPPELDEEIDFLAAQISTYSRDIQCGANLNCLKSNFVESFRLFMDVVRRPRFDEGRLDIYKNEQIETFKQRNDDAESILDREWAALMYGRDHYEAREPTQASIEGITIDDLRSMHRRMFHPGRANLYIAVSGDFEPTEMLSQLERAFEGWTPSETAPEPPAPTAAFAPGVYHVEKDIPQGKVFIGWRGIKRDDPDYFPLLIANHILGGGGFTSRITNRVRSDEGLAYHAASAMQPKVYFPGEIRAMVQSKNPTVALSIKLILEEIQRMRTERVTQDELDTAKKSFIETFPRTFESKPTMLSVFVYDEMTNRPVNYWQTYRDRINAVSADDVQKAAQKHFDTNKAAIFVVGKWDEIHKGDIGGRATMKEFFQDRVTHLPLRDPLTLQPLQN